MWNPLVLVVFIIVVMLAYLNGAGGSGLLKSLDEHGSAGDPFIQGYGQICMYSLIICNIMACFIGVMSVAEDRFKGKTGVLLSKPLFRRDIIIGKFVGISGFITVFIAAMIAITTIMLIIYFRCPWSLDDAIYRLTFYIAGISLECILTMGWGMLIGILVRNLVGAIVLAATFIYSDWFLDISVLLTQSTFLNVLFRYISPRMLMDGIIVPGYNIFQGGYNIIFLFDTSTSFLTWIGAAAPHYFLLSLETGVILMLCITAFMKDTLEKV